MVAIDTTSEESADKGPKNPAGELVLYDKMCDRRESTNTLLWQVPALSLTAQAFLLSISLDASIEPVGRLFAALIGTIAGFATYQLFSRHRHLETRLSVLLEGLEERLEIPRSHKKGWIDNPLFDGVQWKSSDSTLPGRAAKDESYPIWSRALLAIAVIDLIILILIVSEIFNGPSPLVPS